MPCWSASMRLPISLEVLQYVHFTWGVYCSAWSPNSHQWLLGVVNMTLHDDVMKGLK